MEIRTTFFYRAWKSFTVKRYGKWMPIDDPHLLLRSMQCLDEGLDESVNDTEWLAETTGTSRETVHTFYSPNIRCREEPRRLFRNVQVKVVCAFKSE